MCGFRAREDLPLHPSAGLIACTRVALNEQKNNQVPGIIYTSRLVTFADLDFRGFAAFPTKKKLPVFVTNRYFFFFSHSKKEEKKKNRIVTIISIFRKFHVFFHEFVTYTHIFFSR